MPGVMSPAEHPVYVYQEKDTNVALPTHGSKSSPSLQIMKRCHPESQCQHHDVCAILGFLSHHSQCNVNNVRPLLLWAYSIQWLHYSS